MNRKFILYTVAILLGTTLAGPRSGAQTLYGPSGLFIHPTAFTPRKGAITFSASYFTQQIDGQRRTEWVPLGLSYGVTNRLEAGALYADRLAANGHRRGSAGLFLRQQLAPDTDKTPAVALTGSYLGSDVRLAALSLSASHRFRAGNRTAIIGHVGAQWAWRGDGLARDSESLGVFAGIEVPLGGGFSALAEYGSRFGFDYKERSAFGVMWHARNDLSVAVGFVNVGRSSDNRFFIGVGVPLGGNKQ